RCGRSRSPRNHRALNPRARTSRALEPHAPIKASAAALLELARVVWPVSHVLARPIAAPREVAASWSAFQGVPMKCPKCSAEMESVTFEGVSVDRCTGCKGLFFEARKAQKLKEMRGSEVLD